MGNVNRRSPPILERENPAVEAGMFPVYGVVNLYLTFLDDLFEVYITGIKFDREIKKWVSKDG